MPAVQAHYFFKLPGFDSGAFFCPISRYASQGNFCAFYKLKNTLL